MHYCCYLFWCSSYPELAGGIPFKLASVSFWHVIPRPYCYLQFHSHIIELNHIFSLFCTSSLTVGNLPIVILNLLTYLISLPPPPHNSIWASKPLTWKPSSPHLDSYIAQHGASCISLWAPWSGVDTHHWTTAMQGSAHPKPPFQSLGVDSHATLSPPSTTDTCLILLGLWLPLLGMPLCIFN